LISIGHYRMESRKSQSCLRKALVALFLLGIAGCGAKRLAHEHADMRQALLKLYEEQVLDNLIRAHNNRAIVQLDYSNVIGTLTESLGVETVGAASSLDNSFAQKPASGGNEPLKSFPIDKVIGGSFSAKASSSQALQMALTAQPAILTSEIYNAYLDYLRKFPNCLVKQDPDKEPPSRDEVHCAQWFGEHYYYVPSSCGYEFFQLYLATTVQRDTTTVPTAFEFTIVFSEEPVAEGSGYMVPIRLSGRLPNDSGKLKLVMDGKQRSFDVQPDPATAESTLTNRLILLYQPSRPGDPSVADFIRLLQDKKAKIVLARHFPGNTKTSDIIQDIRSQLELLRLQQQLQTQP